MSTPEAGVARKRLPDMTGLRGTRLEILFLVTPERYNVAELQCSYPFCFLFSLFSTAKHDTNPASSLRHGGREGEKTTKSHRDREGELEERGRERKDERDAEGSRKRFCC